MKILKLYIVFAVLILSVVFLMWIMNLVSSEQSLDILMKSGSVIGFLFLVTLVLQLVTKPQNQNSSDGKK